VTRPGGLRVLAGRLLGGGALARDYSAGRDLSPFFTGQPAELESYRRKAAEVERRLDGDARRRLAPSIHALGDAGDRLERILDGDGFFVTTGQQPALFGGPLYTLYKILAAIRLAEELETRLQRPVLALFWIGSDDHDWEEANHATLLDGSDYVERVEVRAEHGAPPLPLSERVWGSDVGRAVERLVELLPATPFGRRIAEHVRTTYTPDATVAASSTATLRLLLEDRRLAMVDSADPAVRRAAAPVLRHEALHAQEHAAQTASRTELLSEAGYRVQVAVSADASNLMLIDEHGRDRLVRLASGWVTRREHRAMSDAELLGRIDAGPEQFSPNVLLRPVVESALFPTIAYVAGPGEISYFAQIGRLFDAHGIQPPVVVPRPSVTLVEPAIERILERLDMTPAELQRPFDELASLVVRRHLPAEIHAALLALRESLHEGYDRLTELATRMDPTLEGPLTGARNAGLIRTREAEKKIVARMKHRNGELLEQVRRAAAHLYPGGAPQERVLNVLPFAARHGPDLIAQIEDSLDMALAPLAGARASGREP
jgi:bacillithiol synthase